MNPRLYQLLARRLTGEIARGLYPLNSRLPAERDLAALYAVSRPTMREAIIALEVQGLIEVRVGSGAYVVRLPGKGEQSGFNLSAFEITEARLLIEGEVAALAATQASADDLAGIAVLVAAIDQENADPRGKERADRAFHLAIATATGNRAMRETVERLWDQRETSPESALLHHKARSANVKPVVEEHRAVLDALIARDPVAARAAMRAHLAAVLDSLLFATEEKALDDARLGIAAKRARYGGAA